MADNLLSADEAIEKALATATEAESGEKENEQEGEKQTSTEEETEETELEETKDGKQNKGKTKKESTDDEAEESDDDTQESDESPEIDERTADALALWDSLESENALEVLQQIASKAGLKLVASTETKGATKSETKITTLEVAKQIFGKDYDFIAEKMALVLDKVLEEKVEKPLRASAEAQEIRTLNTEITTFLNANKGAEKHTKKIVALINDMPPRPGVNLQTYLGRIYKLAASDAAETTRVRKVVDKISENAKRTNTRSSEVATQSVKRGSKLPSIDEALDAAAKGIQFEFEE